MESVLVLAAVVVAVGLAVRYLYRAKKRGVKCIGCSCGKDDCHCGKK